MRRGRGRRARRRRGRAGASPLDGAIASTRAPPVQRRPNRSSAAIASLASGIESSRCDVVRAEAVHARPGPRRRRPGRCGCASRGRRARRRPGAACDRHVEVELGQPAQLLGEDRGLPGPLRRQGDVRELSAAHATGPAAGHADSTRSGRRLEHLDGVGAPELRGLARVGQPRADALARAACAGRRRRDPRAGRRSARRGRPGRSRARRARRRRPCRVSSHAEPYPGPAPRAPSAPRRTPAATARTPRRRRA